MTTATARRLVLEPGVLAATCRSLALTLPPGFDLPPGRSTEVHPSVAAGLLATCAPRVGVVVTSTVRDVAAAFGVRDDLGGSVLRAAGSAVEVSSWPPTRLGMELLRAVPRLGAGRRLTMHAPLPEIAERSDLREAVIGTLRATVVAPPHVVGQVIWLATADGWLSLDPAEVRGGVRWATVGPVDAGDLGTAVAPFVASALS